MPGHTWNSLQTLKTRTLPLRLSTAGTRGEEEEELMLQMAMLASVMGKHEEKDEETDETWTLKEYEAEYSKFIQRVRYSVEMTEDDLQDACQKLLKASRWIQKFLAPQKCNYLEKRDIADIRKAWKKNHNNHELSEQEKLIPQIRDHYWCIRESDKKLKMDIQSFIKNIASKTEHELLEMKKELRDIMRECQEKCGYHRNAVWIETCDENYRHNDTFNAKNESFIDAVCAIESNLRQLWNKFKNPEQADTTQSRSTADTAWYSRSHLKSNTQKSSYHVDSFVSIH